VIKIHLSGEGAFELGGRVGDPAYRTERPGVIEALLRAHVPDGWEVCGARTWKDIPKVRARPGETAEVQNVRGAVLDAREAQCDVLVFVRDRDRRAERERLIDVTVQELREAGARIVGGVACQCVDAWVLAIAGETGSEGHASGDAKRLREARAPRTEDAVALVQQRGLASVAPDATSLRSWLAAAGAELAG
jgi:hypothetical protein